MRLRSAAMTVAEAAACGTDSPIYSLSQQTANIIWLNTYLQCFDNCWLGVRKGIQSAKN